MKLTVALLQMEGHGFNQEANCAKGTDFCRQAAERGADIALFPEMWNIGYKFYDPAQPETRRLWDAQAISMDSPFVAHFRELARELGIAIGLTLLETSKERPRNTIALIDRHGDIALTYSKVHTCEFDVECALEPGDDFYVCNLDTAAGPVKIGAMICYDREFPESARVLMLKGAEIILTPNACEMEIHRTSQFRSRASENMVGVALANYAGAPNNGHSMAFDAVCFDDKGNSLDNCLVEAGPDEGVYLATFDLDRLRKWRSVEAWGNAYRRPRLYQPIVSEEVQPPFVRKDATR